MVVKKLATGAITTGAGTLLYTVPTGYMCEISDIILVNTDTSGSADVALYFVPVGVAVSAGNKSVSLHQIAHSTYHHWNGKQVLNAGDFIQGIASAATFTVHITGEETRVSI